MSPTSKIFSIRDLVSKPMRDLAGLTNRKIAYVLFLSLAAITVEAIGLFSLLPIFKMMESGVQEISTDEIFGENLQHILPFEVEEYTIRLALAVAIGLLLVRSLVTFLKQITVDRLSQDIAYNLRAESIKKTFGKDFETLDRITAGWLNNFLLVEIPRLCTTYNGLLSLVTSVMLICFLVIVSLIISFQLTAIAIIPLVVVLFLAKRLLKITRRISQELTIANTDFSEFSMDRIFNWPLIKLFRGDDEEIRSFHYYASKLSENSYKLSYFRSILNLIIEPLIIFIGGLVIFTSSHYLALSLADLGLLGIILLRLKPVFQESVRVYQSILSNGGAVALVKNFFESTNSRSGFSGVFRIGNSEMLVFEKVSYRYPGAVENAVSDLSISIPLNRLILIAGISGAGKTTLAELISGARMPNSGVIYYPDRFFDNNLQRPAGLIYLQQKALVLRGSIRKNLSLAEGMRRDPINEEEMISVLKEVGAWEFVARLPRGIDTEIGHGLSNVSGGQLQRLAIARALLSLPKILILDEPTSALDSESERAINRILVDLVANRNITVFVIAHQLDIADLTDYSLIVDNGTVSVARDFSKSEIAAILKPKLLQD